MLQHHYYLGLNRYVLKVPSGVKVSGNVLAQAKRDIAMTNSLIASQGLTIDVQSKVATIDEVSTRSYGKTSISVYWNYARIYLNRDWATGIRNGSIGVAGFLAGKIPNPYTAGAAAAVIAILGGLNINNGIWIDYNYFTGVNKWGWQ